MQKITNITHVKDILYLKCLNAIQDTHLSNMDIERKYGVNHRHVGFIKNNVEVRLSPNLLIKVLRKLGIHVNITFKEIEPNETNKD